MRIFLSSTCYNSPDLRAVLEDHIIRLGHEPILSDRFYFPINVGMHRHDACLEAIRDADLVVLVIEPRYGAPYYKNPNISITWAEYNTAVEYNKPIISFIRNPIFDERKTWLANDKAIIPAHCDSIRIFDFIDEIQKHEKGHWIHTHFTTVNDIILSINSIGGLDELVKKYDVLNSADPISHLSLETKEWIMNRLNWDNFPSELEFADIEKLKEALPKVGGLRILLDSYMIPLTQKGSLVYDVPFKPAEDDFSSFYCETYLTPLGRKIKAEIELSYYKFQNKQD